MQRIIEQVNAVISSFINLEKEQSTVVVKENENDDAFYKEAEAAYFSPEKGNIVFCSAIDCWSFRLSDFADIFAEKLEIRKDVSRNIYN